MMPGSLYVIRQLLNPSVRAYNGQHPSLELDIAVDYVRDKVVVNGLNPKTKETAEFSITRNEIDNKSYISSFKPNVLSLISKLEL